MLTGKQRAKLRGMANALPAIFQIGKGGIGPELVAQVGDALEARELVKLSVLETAGCTAHEALEELCASLGAEPVQAIGRKLVLYRRSTKSPTIEL